MTATHTSIVTPEAVVLTNGKAPKTGKLRHVGLLKASVAAVDNGKMTAEEACAIAFESGECFASIQDRLSGALIYFKDNAVVREAMLASMNHGYLCKKLGYTLDKARETMGKAKHSDNPKLQDDKHRTFEEQRVVDTVRVLWHRVNKLAGTLAPKSEAQVKAEVARAANEAERKETVSALAEIVYPKGEVDVNEAMTRLVSTMKAFHAKHSAKFTGDRGQAWRDWLAAAPK